MLAFSFLKSISEAVAVIHGGASSEVLLESGILNTVWGLFFFSV
jgi:hypothetical protein